MNEPPVLTDRELDVLDRLAMGAATKEIATFFGISEHTAKFHVTNLARKLRVETRVQTVVRALQLGLLKLESIEVPITESVLVKSSCGQPIRKRAVAA